MEPTQQNQMGTPTGTPQEEKSIGALIGSIIVIAVIVIGGIYFWMTQSTQSPTPTETPSLGQTVTPDQETAALLSQGTSTEIPDIEKDLNATNLDNLDAGMKDIDAQL
jgi:flagellar basal body-associated protein FliL